MRSKGIRTKTLIAQGMNANVDKHLPAFQNESGCIAERRRSFYEHGTYFYLQKHGGAFFLAYNLPLVYTRRRLPKTKVIGGRVTPNHRCLGLNL